jgi:DNA repair exonuclease SbcCD ATPase subunit
MISNLLKGEAVAGAAYFVMEALTPVKWSGEWGTRKLIALGQYGMIAGTAVGFVTALFMRVMGDKFSFVLAASWAATSLFGAYAFKQYHSFDGLDKYTKKIGTDADKIDEGASKVNHSVEELQEIIRQKELHEKERQEAADKLVAELKDMKLENERLQKNVHDLEAIPSSIGNSIEALSKKINDFTTERKELNADLKGAIQKQHSEIESTLTHLDSANKQTGEQLGLLDKLIKSLETVVQSILSLYQEVETKLQEEFKTWQLDKLIEALDKTSTASGTIQTTQGELDQSKKLQEELGKLLASRPQAKQTLRELLK